MLRWDDIAPGMVLAGRTLGPITRTDLVRYQGASGDMNPIHHDEPFARKAGYAAPLVVGMYPAGALAAWAAGMFGAENVRRVRIRWKEQMWPDDVLAFSGTVVSKSDGEGEKWIELELAATRQTGGVAIQIWMTFAAL